MRCRGIRGWRHHVPRRALHVDLGRAECGAGGVGARCCGCFGSPFAVAGGYQDTDSDAGDVADEGGQGGETAADDAAGYFGDAVGGQRRC